MFQEPPRPYLQGKWSTTLSSAEIFKYLFYAILRWAKPMNLCTVSIGIIGALITNCNQNLSYGHLIEYLNPDLFTTIDQNQCIQLSRIY